MTARAFRTCLLFIIIIGFATGCANIVPPSGGKKDTRPPKLLAVSPADSQLNTRVTRVEMKFDEYVDPTVPVSEVTVSPLLPMPVSIMADGRKVILKIPDSLLKDETTYRVSFGNAIKDLHEGNVFTGYTYTFSTGGYFDSLNLWGFVKDAVSGMDDTGAHILLYNALESDSAVVRKKPLYVTKVKQGKFFMAGLPKRPFKIYALRDANNNQVYDGGTEAIAFIDRVVIPADTFIDTIMLKVFVEENTDTTKRVAETSLGKRSRKNADKEDFGYAVQTDTSNITKRTQDVTKPLIIKFNKEPDTINTARMNLSYDSSGISVEVPFTVSADTVKENNVLLNINWQEDKLYTLRLLKGFARDSSQIEAMPSRHSFRTKNDDDYAKLTVHVPGKYHDKKYLLLVFADADTVHYKPITDTMVRLVKLHPANYSLKIVQDDNLNRKWDTGDLLEKRQPEEVIPYDMPVQLKAGWDNTIDFVREEKKKPEKPSPGKRDKSPSK